MYKQKLYQAQEKLLQNPFRLAVRKKHTAVADRHCQPVDCTDFGNRPAESNNYSVHIGFAEIDYTDFVVRNNCSAENYCMGYSGY